MFFPAFRKVFGENLHLLKPWLKPPWLQDLESESGDVWLLRSGESSESRGGRRFESVGIRWLQVGEPFGNPPFVDGNPPFMDDFPMKAFILIGDFPLPRSITRGYYGSAIHQKHIVKPVLEGFHQAFPHPVTVYSMPGNSFHFLGFNILFCGWLPNVSSCYLLCWAHTPPFGVWIVVIAGWVVYEEGFPSKLQCSGSSKKNPYIESKGFYTFEHHQNHLFFLKKKTHLQENLVNNPW